MTVPETTPDPDQRYVAHLPLPKAHDVPLLDRSFRRHGLVEIPTIDERTGRLVAGHGRVETLVEQRAAGSAPPRGVKLDPAGRWLVPTLRGWASTDDDDAESYLLTSNQATIAPGWDVEQLAEMALDLGARVDLTEIGWTPAQLDEITAAATRDTTPPPAPPDPYDGPDPDADLPEIVEPLTRLGDLWQLGPHRLRVGDAFDAAALAHLLGPVRRVDAITTDPPFAIYGSSSGISEDIADDKMIRPFFASLGRVMASTVKAFGHVYVCCDWRSFATVWDGAKAGGLSPKNCIVWDKGGSGLGSMYANAHEFAAFFVRQPKATAMRGGQTGQRTVYQPNVWRGPRPHGEERLHNAAKPVDLFVWLITNATDDGETVLDLFGGSGCTIVAAHRTNRVSFTMELDPKNADLIAYRYQRETGTLPVLLARAPAATTPDGAPDPVDLPEPEPADFLTAHRRG